ncbi:MAG TPA: preprotein translocase subunit SecE [Pseudonocardiaceae bacterium]|nr:preprotein translocase subunit SecE [Pseudonocardiaceae bacterium]
MTEDREQDRPDERDGAARPVTAAARRERRASASGTTPTGRAGRAATTAKPAGSASSLRTRRAKTDEDAEDSVDSTGTARKGKATPARDRQDNRPGMFARLFRFLREVVGELRKVIWPTRKQQLTYTVVVLVFVAVIVAVVSGLDVLFAKGVFWIFA